jgi:hypothetical protein
MSLAQKGRISFNKGRKHSDETKDKIRKKLIGKYYGNKKPSVDTPVQLMIYQNAPAINYMIHGHYYVYGAPFTKSFYPLNRASTTLPLNSAKLVARAVS